MPRRSTYGLLALLLLIGGNVPAPAQEVHPSNTAVMLEKLVRTQIKAFNDEEPAAAMAVFHPQVPNLRELRASLVNQFRAADLRFELKEQHYVGQEGPYAYMRTIKTIQGQHNNKPYTIVLEELQVFRRHKGEWKAWTAAELNKTFHGPKRSGAPRGPR